MTGCAGCSLFCFFNDALAGLVALIFGCGIGAYRAKELHFCLSETFHLSRETTVKVGKATYVKSQELYTTAQPHAAAAGSFVRQKTGEFAERVLEKTRSEQGPAVGQTSSAGLGAGTSTGTEVTDTSSNTTTKAVTYLQTVMQAHASGDNSES
mmetsp:Transcript_40368/g.107061  ORF Transcript_40368/g.107061 Transcript_40368/m.107061 type:complete len:153 (-) Transcript_40368:291-749(-)